MIDKKITFFTFFFFYLFIMLLGVNYDWHEVWSSIGFNFTSKEYYFGDIRNVTNYSQFKVLGFNAREDYFTNNLGQTIPPFNYPSIWLIFDCFDVSNSDTIYFGFSFFVLFSIGVYLIINMIKSGNGYFMIPLLFSPVVALIIERGNNDQVAFFFVVVFCFVYKNKVLSTLSYYLAFLTKFFPVVVIMALTANFNLRFVKKLALYLLPVLAYILASYPEIVDLGKATPVSIPMIGYGWKTYLSELEKIVGGSLATIASILSLLIVVMCFLFFKVNHHRDDVVDEKLVMFTSGMLIYVGTFFIGTSFDYRLIFLLLVVPALLEVGDYLSKLTMLIIVFLFWAHQIILVLNYLGDNFYVFKMLAYASIVIKIILHYILIFMLIYYYKVFAKPSILGFKI